MIRILHSFKCIITVIALVAISVVANAQVNADFSAPVVSGCSPLIVNFQNQSTGSNLTYQWNLGNGNTSVAVNPSASYINPGVYTVTLTATGPGGTDTETKTAYITVFTPPTPNLAPSQNIGCYPFTVNFSDLSTPGDSPIATWSWDFGDGSTSTAQNPNHTYNTPGFFDVTLLLTDANGCASNISINDLVESNSNAPTAQFTADPTISCLPPVDVTFSNTSSGGTGTLTYLWDFGDGNTSTLQNPTYPYTTSGVFDVSLTVTDQYGCNNSSVVQDYITIADNVTIDFSANNTTVCLGDQVSFVDLSSPTPTSWQWDFGDGNTSTQQFPTHLYTTAGTYEVSLTAVYSASCQGTETKTAYITVGEIPFSDFGSDITESCTSPQTINFTEQAVGNGPMTYQWNFGDGNTSTAANPAHEYQTFGSYDVSLTVTNTFGCSSTASETSYINIAETTADFLPDVFGFCQPLEVNFSDLSISGTNIVSYEWDFGDGGTSNLQNPTYTYADTGIFDVQLIITNELGCTDTLTRSSYIFVYTPPVADFLNNGAVICPGFEFQFTDLSQNATDWFWDFGDMNSSTDQNPVHEYADTGHFDITLITLNNGCSDTLVFEDFLYVSPPIANMFTSFNCEEPNVFIFTPNPEGETSWQWILPDGSTSTDDPLVYSHTDTGMFIMRIQAFNDTSGCVNTDSDTLFVTELISDFNATNTQDCAPLQVAFTDMSTDAVEWHWNFGDGSTSNQQNPLHTYTQIGSYTVRLIVEDVNGCTDTLILPDLVTVTGSIIDFGIGSTVGCDTLAVQFEDQTSPSNTVTDWLWNFGDGQTSTQQNPNHIYQNAGVYDVTLTITDLGGCVSTVTQNDLINYIPYPNPSFTVDQTLGCIGDVFTFSNSSTGNATSYLWNFGDGNTSTAQNPTHSYGVEGTFSVTLTAFNANGCDSSITQINLISIQHPDADFSAYPTFAFCPPLLVSFTDLSSVDATSWFWDFGDNSSSSLQNPSHIYTQSGVYSVRLIVTNANGCTDTLFVPDLIVLSGPTGEFTFFPDSIGCPPYEITFTAAATNADTYTWDFGDGSLGTGETTDHIYTQIGSYIPTLILEDNNGCTFTYQSADTLRIEPLAVSAGSDVTICETNSTVLNATGGNVFSWWPPTGLDDPNTASPNASPTVTTEYVVTVQLGLCQNTDTVTVFVNPAPTVNFSAADVCFGNPTQFVDLSGIAAPDSIVAWDWDLSEALSTDTNPSIIYSAPGSYDITLMLTSSNGCVTSGSGSALVNPSPNAAFSATDTCLYNVTLFTDQSSVSSGNITSWNWQLGNGATSVQQNPSTTYPQDSIYQVTLVVTALGGCTDTVTQPVEVYPLPVAAVTAANVCLGEAVSFGDSTTINSGSIVSWDWDFGDSNSSSAQHPQHVYGNDQTYVYSLTVTSDHGCQDAASSLVTVHPLPVSSFQMTSTSSCTAPVSVNLFNQSAGANQFAWDHDNGITATTFNSTAIFDTVGQYNIQLLVTNQFGCQDSSTQLFEVFPTVIAQFETSDPDGCEPWSVDFIDLSENGIDYSWDFNDAPGSSLSDPTHIFENDGSYTVTLIVSGLGGCADTITYQNIITVFPNPTANFEYSNIQDSIANGTIAFYNTSSPHVSSWWDFGDGSSSTSESTTHNYDYFGNYYTTLAIVDANGCVDTLSMYITVNFFGGLFVPNAIIPTYDDPNIRGFLPAGSGLAYYRCLIFDKWGNEIWQSTALESGSPSEAWDGTYRGEIVPQGAYVWKIDAIFGNGTVWDGMDNGNGEFHQVGTVTVIR